MFIPPYLKPGRSPTWRWIEQFTPLYLKTIHTPPPNPPPPKQQQVICTYTHISLLSLCYSFLSDAAGLTPPSHILGANRAARPIWIIFQIRIWGLGVGGRGHLPKHVRLGKEYSFNGAGWSIEKQLPVINVWYLHNKGVVYSSLSLSLPSQLSFDWGP